MIDSTPFRLRSVSLTIALIACAELVSNGQEPVAPVVDCSTLSGKVMVGYQGWFNCAGDGSGLGWKHWARRANRPFGPGNVTVDLWPDVSELGADEQYETEFTMPDGSSAVVFSSANGKTVERHFRWMRDYGIDGAFVQRFANQLGSPKRRANVDRVLAHVRSGAKKNGRAFAVMYDLSGLQSGQVDQVRQDWIRLRKQVGVTHDPTYLHHKGKPLVSIWGVGFSDNRAYSLQECDQLVDALKDEGCSVMLGVPSYWREGRRDAVDDPMLRQIIAKADVVSPWTVGRYRSPDEARKHADGIWVGDREWCEENGSDFLPVVYPGFSWHNLHGGALGKIPRLGGDFLWSQVKGAKKAGCDMLYVAMFDEVDEGTAVFKCTNHPPSDSESQFLTYKGLPPDHYLKLTGRAGKLLRDEIKE